MLQSVPPVSAIVRPALADIPPQDQVPRPWSPAAYQGIHIGSVESLPAWRTAPTCGVVTIVNDSWMPVSSRSVPPSLCNRLGMYLASRWCLLFNESADARKKNHWALPTCKGNAIVLAGILPGDRPLNPSDFPECVIGGLPLDVAYQLSTGANLSRCGSGIPKLWSVAVRRIDSITDDSEGEVTQ